MRLRGALALLVRFRRRDWRLVHSALHRRAVLLETLHGAAVHSRLLGRFHCIAPIVKGPVEGRGCLLKSHTTPTL